MFSASDLVIPRKAHSANLMRLVDGLNEVTLRPHMAGMVAAMAESEQDVASERASYNILGEPGQRHEEGKAFGGLV